MKKKYLITFLILLGCSKKDETKSIYNIYNECYAQNFTIRNKSIKHYIRQYENILIKNKLLRDSTASSYVNFFYGMSNYDYIDLKENYSFLDSIKGLEFGKDVLNCVKKISNHKDFEKGFWGKYIHYIKTNSLELSKENTLHFLSSQPLDSIFNEDTFQYDYFRYKLFNIIKVSQGKNKTSGAILFIKENYPKRAEIYVNSSNKIFWNKEKVKLRDIHNKVFKYIKDFSNEKIVFLITEKETNFGYFVAVKNEITKAENSLKNLKSNNTYKINYTDLIDSQKESIDKKYTLKIAEKTETLPN